MKKMYRATFNAPYVTGKIVTKETDSYVWVDDTKAAKITDYARFFDTEREAWQWIAEHYRSQHNTLTRRADEALFAFQKIEEHIKKLNQ